MTQEEFIQKAKELGLKVTEANKVGWPEDFDGVYVTGKTETVSCGLVNRRHTPYIRVSGFSDGELYIRKNGICGIANDEVVLASLKRLAERSL